MNTTLLEERHRIIRGIREFFWARGFLEIETPVVLPYPSQEPYLEPLRTIVHDHRGHAHDGFLRMSPEFSIKKLLPLFHERVTKSTNGFQSTNRKNDGHSQIGIHPHIRYHGVFELGPVFRDGEPWGGSHNPEFTMLEWYELGADYRKLMTTCEELMRSLRHSEVTPTASSRSSAERRRRNLTMRMAGAMGEISPARGGQALVARNDETRKLVYQNHRIDLSLPWERLTMREAWKRYAKLNLDKLLGATKWPTPGVGHSQGARTAMAKACRTKGYTVTKDDTFDDLFFKIHLTEVEPKLGRTQPTFLTDWPSQMAALARRKPKDPRYAERVELYIAGIELTNGFSELTDADEQLSRFRADQRLRRKLGRPVYPIDQNFIAALRHLPPCAGMALGVDRLVMLLTDAASIDEVRWLPATELFSAKTLDD